jgi:hypothetical protein
MRTRVTVCLLACCCCAALAGCTTAQANQPATTVSTPKVGRPPAPASAQAALSSEAFTPYAALGLSSDDGLAPGESDDTLAGPCMNAAGYPDVTINDGIVRVGIFAGIFGTPSYLAYTYPWGGWGYLGTADAQQYGFQFPFNSALSELGLGGAQPASLPSVPAAEQAAANKCSTIINDFTHATGNGPAMAVIFTLVNDIYADMGRDRAVHAAAKAWSACMAKNGYSSLGAPQDVDAQEQQNMYGTNPDPSATVSPAANPAQITAAVTDAGCTQSSDLAGIYFAVQASFEQQLVSANRQALTAAVSYYRTAYTKELKRLPALLRITKVRPFPKPNHARPSSHTG